MKTPVLARNHRQFNTFVRMQRNKPNNNEAFTYVYAAHILRGYTGSVVLLPGWEDNPHMYNIKDELMYRKLLGKITIREEVES